MNKEVIESIEDLIGCRKKFNNKEYGTFTEEQFTSRMAERFENLSENFPTIFEKSVSGFFDNPNELSRLYMAMGLIEKTKAGGISKEDGEKAFGQHLVDVFVTPNLPEKK
jgi:hypothetical protein